jgi:hypothetical protein
MMIAVVVVVIVGAVALRQEKRRLGIVQVVYLY